MANKQTYALVLRDAEGTFLGVLGTQRQLKTRHGKVTPAFHARIVSLFKLVPAADRIAVVAWQRGMDVKAASPLLIAHRMEQPSQVTYGGLGESEVKA